MRKIRELLFAKKYKNPPSRFAENLRNITQAKLSRQRSTVEQLTPSQL
jgi:hypothetical protein